MIQDNKKNIKRKDFFLSQKIHSLAPFANIEEIIFPYSIKKKRELLSCKVVKWLRLEKITKNSYLSHLN